MKNYRYIKVTVHQHKYGTTVLTMPGFITNRTASGSTKALAMTTNIKELPARDQGVPGNRSV